jgi:hypothetical protein
MREMQEVREGQPNKIVACICVPFDYPFIGAVPPPKDCYQVTSSSVNLVGLATVITRGRAAGHQHPQHQLTALAGLAEAREPLRAKVDFLNRFKLIWVVRS